MTGEAPGTSETYRLCRALVVGVRRPVLETERMRKALTLFGKFAKNEDGAALVEYAVLLGIMLVAVIATIIAVGAWVNTHWTSLNTALAGH